MPSDSKTCAPIPIASNDHDLLIRVDSHISVLMERIDRLENQVSCLQKTVSTLRSDQSSDRGFKAGVVFAVGLASSLITAGVAYLMTR